MGATINFAALLRAGTVYVSRNANGARDAHGFGSRGVVFGTSSDCVTGGATGLRFSKGSGTVSFRNGAGFVRAGTVPDNAAAFDASMVRSSSGARSGDGFARIGSGIGLFTSTDGTRTRASLGRFLGPRPLALPASKKSLEELQYA